MPLTFPPSFFQELQVARTVGGRTSENVPTVVRLLGDVAPHALRQALDALGAAHETLRTALVPEPVLHQRVLPEAPIPLRVVDLDRRTASAPGRALRRLVRAEREEPFALGVAPMARAVLVGLGPRDRVLVLTVSHVFWDAVSRQVLLEDLARCLRALAAGRAPDLAPGAVQFGDWTQWQRSLRLPRREAFWARRLHGAGSLMAVGTDRPRRPTRTIGLAAAEVPPALARRLRRLARDLGTTLATAVLTAYAIAVAWFTGRTEATVAMTHANRDRPELRRVIGFCSDAFVVRLDLSRCATGADAVRAVHEWIVASHRCWLPVERQRSHLDPGWSHDVQPAMHEVVLNVTPAADAAGARAVAPPAAGAVDLRPLEAPVAALSPDAGWHAVALYTNLAPDGRGGLRGRVEFNPHTLDAPTVAAVLARFTAALRLLALRPGAMLAGAPTRIP
jgi:hypothetical protein